MPHVAMSVARLLRLGLMALLSSSTLGQQDSDCACSSSCDRFQEPLETCTEGIPACGSNQARIGDIGLAVLHSNPVYRLHDLVWHAGNRYRIDCMTILCEPRYRGTVFRRVLQDMSTWHGIPVLRYLPDAHVEAFVASLTDTEKAGVYYLQGLGGGGPHGPYTENRGPSDLNIPNAGSLQNSTAAVLKKMKEADECIGLANDNELVIAVRAGDANSEANEILDTVTTYLNVSEHRSSIAGAVVSTVLHYGNDKYMSVDAESDIGDERSLNRIHEIVAKIEEEFGLSVRVRSEPTVDLDLCFYVFAKHIVGPAGRGMYRLAEDIREYL